MQLIKCHVENFGTLHDFDIEFNKGLCIIKEDNGFGKTTSAAFIKAMFYGMNKYQGRDLDKNDRARYKPWQGGNFGGNLDFATDSGTYRIERFFGPKDKDDTFRLFDLDKGVESNAYTENIGVELFGIDAESFERSIFLPQQRLDSGMNASINAKLTGLVENSDDIGNFDRAMAELKKQASARGVKGRLEKTEKEIIDLERQINDRRSASDGLELLNVQQMQIRNEIAVASGEVEKLRARITAASDHAAAMKDLERRKELSDELEKATEKVNELSQKYKNGLPSDEDILTVTAAVQQYSAVASGLKMISDGTEEQERFETVGTFFKNGVPDRSEITLCRDRLAQLQTLRGKAAAIEPQLEESASRSKSKGSKGAQTAVLIIAVILFLAGLGLLFVDTVIGIALLSVGIISAGVSGFLVLKGMISAGNNSGAAEREVLKQQYEHLNAEISALQDSVNSFLSKFSDGQTDISVETVAAKLTEYETAKQSLEQLKLKISGETARLDALSQEIEPFFMQYLGAVPEDRPSALIVMREDVRVLKSAKETVVSCTEKLGAIPVAVVQETEETLSREELIAKERELSVRIDSLKGQLVTVEKQKNAAENAADAVQELVSNLEQMRTEAEELGKMLEVVKLTGDILQQARDGLSSRYMTVLKSGFEKYTLQICGAGVGEFMLDNDLNLNLEREGKGRAKDCFSEGYKDMLDICMRLALIDALYDGEKPMLILDDPFVNLDDERVKNALKMLDELGKDRQIIYLTCHSSRIPE